MQAIAKPVIVKLQRFYRSESDESAEEREAAGQMTLGSIQKLAAGPTSEFKVRNVKTKVPQIDTQVNFRVLITELEAVKKHLRQPNMSKSELGHHVFDYYLKSEGLK